MPESLTATGLDAFFPCPCPCSIFTDLHPIANDPQDARSQPFYEVSRAPGSAYTSGDEAQGSINKLQPLDSDMNIFILLAHDSILFDVLPLFNDRPDRDINDWQARGYKSKTHWGFLNEFPRNNRPGRMPLVNGLRRNGRVIVYGSDGEFHYQAEIGNHTNKSHCEHVEMVSGQFVGH